MQGKVRAENPASTVPQGVIDVNYWGWCGESLHVRNITGWLVGLVLSQQSTTWQARAVSSASSEQWLSLTQVCELLSLTPSRVHRLIEDHALIATRIDGGLVVPAGCFVNGQPVAHLAGTMTLLLDGGFDVERAVGWMLEHHDELGASPLEALGQGHKTAVRRIAQTLAL